MQHLGTPIKGAAKVTVWNDRSQGKVGSTAKIGNFSSVEMTCDQVCALMRTSVVMGDVLETGAETPSRYLRSLRISDTHQCEKKFAMNYIFLLFSSLSILNLHQIYVWLSL